MFVCFFFGGGVGGAVLPIPIHPSTQMHPPTHAPIPLQLQGRAPPGPHAAIGGALRVQREGPGVVRALARVLVLLLEEKCALG